MNKLVVICGPTAAGKTALGVKLAKKFNGEIVSVDSRQVYIGMDVGTGKDVQGGKWYVSNLEWGMEITERTEKEQITRKLGYWEIEEIPIWLYDVVEPDENFSVADYCFLARRVIEDIWQRGRIPFLVGGTGFYIKAITEGIESLGIEPDWELRERLQSHSIMELQKMLKETDPERIWGMNESDQKNPRRLIRAIEIAIKMQNAKCKMQNYNPKFEIKDYLLIGLSTSYKTLYQRIDRRVEERIQMGAEKEVRQLLKRGYSWDLPAMSSRGYCEWQPYFEGKQNLREVVQRWKYDEHGLARRQMSWFRKTLRRVQGQWFDITQKDFDKEIEKIIQSFLSG